MLKGQCERRINHKMSLESPGKAKLIIDMDLQQYGKTTSDSTPVHQCKPKWKETGNNNGHLLFCKRLQIRHTCVIYPTDGVHVVDVMRKPRENPADRKVRHCARSQHVCMQVLVDRCNDGVQHLRCVSPRKTKVTLFHSVSFICAIIHTPQTQ